MPIDLATSGIYSIPLASRLLGIPQQKLRGWVFGYSRTRSEPIIRNELERLDGDLALSFASLMEARFIAEFAKRGIHVRSIRMMAEEARDLLKHPHPFATVRFRTDGKKIFADVAEKTGDKRLYDLQTKNWALYDVMNDYLTRGVTFDQEGNASSWEPSSDRKVILHPCIAFGEPVLKDSKIPTRTLFDAFGVEGETYDSVAKWYGISVEDVEEAIRFEMEFPKAA